MSQVFVESCDCLSCLLAQRDIFLETDTITVDLRNQLLRIIWNLRRQLWCFLSWIWLSEEKHCHVGWFGETCSGMSSHSQIFTVNLKGAIIELQGPSTVCVYGICAGNLIKVGCDEICTRSSLRPSNQLLDSIPQRIRGCQNMVFRPRCRNKIVSLGMISSAVEAIRLMVLNCLPDTKQNCFDRPRTVNLRQCCFLAL